MAALLFNNSTGNLTWSTLATALQNSSDAYTAAALIRRGGTGQFDAVAYLLDTGVAQAGFSVANDDSILTDTGSGARTPGAIVTTSDVYMLVVSKAAGTATPRLAYKIGVAGSWTHVNLNSNEDVGTAADSLEIGVWETAADFFNGHIGLVAFWTGAMSDGDKEALDNNWRTSDWWNSAHGQPTFLAELNVAAGSVVDLAGNASGLSHTGTSLDAGETLDSWNFNGTGVGGAAEVTYGGNPRRGVASVA